jgi:hypothetical protein
VGEGDAAREEAVGVALQVAQPLQRFGGVLCLALRLAALERVRAHDPQRAVGGGEASMSISPSGPAGRSNIRPRLKCVWRPQWPSPTGVSRSTPAVSSQDRNRLSATRAAAERSSWIGSVTWANLASSSKARRTVVSGRKSSAVMVDRTLASVAGSGAAVVIKPSR